MVVSSHETEDFFRPCRTHTHPCTVGHRISRKLIHYVQNTLNLTEFIVHSTLEQDMLIASYKTEDFLIILVLFRPCRTHIHPCTVGH